MHQIILIIVRVKQFSIKIIIGGQKTIPEFKVLITLLLMVCSVNFTVVIGQDMNGDSLKIETQIEFSNKDSTEKISLLPQSKLFYRIVNTEREPIVHRRSILDRTFTLPRTIWNKMYSPLDTFIIWG